MSVTELQSTLSDLGIDATSLSPLVGDPSIVTLIVPGGAFAVSVWEKLSGALAITGRWPIICGEAEEFLQYNEDIDYTPVNEILGNVPGGLPIESLRIDHRERLRKSMDSFRKMGLPVPEAFTKLADNDENWNDSAAEKPVGPWPDKEPAPPEFHSVSSVLERTPHERCLLALVPTTEPADAPAFLRFGGFNDCPPPEIHVAVLRDWGKRYRAVPVCIMHDVIECLVAAPPTTRPAATALARQQSAYCNDIVSQGTQTVDRLAFEIWKSPQWFFWWD